MKNALLLEAERIEKLQRQLDAGRKLKETEHFSHLYPDVVDVLDRDQRAYFFRRARPVGGVWLLYVELRGGTAHMVGQLTSEGVLDEQRQVLSGEQIIVRLATALKESKKIFKRRIWGAIFVLLGLLALAGALILASGRWGGNETGRLLTAGILLGVAVALLFVGQRKMAEARYDLSVL